jgi:capsular polysaccharide transport system permease protein
VRALQIQLRVIHALILRETRTRFGRQRLGYIWALAEPVIFLTTFAAIYLILERQAPGRLPLVAFLVAGFVPFLAFQKTVSQTRNAISGNKGLLYYPSVRPLDLVSARTLLEFATYLVVFALLMGGAAVVEGNPGIDSLLRTLVGLLLAVGLGASFGLVVCGVSVFSSAVEQLVGPLMRPLFWISALFFSTNELPTVARKPLLYNPLLHVVELTRGGWFPGYEVDEVTPLYPLAWIAVLTYFGLVLERVARRRLELT